MNTINNNGKKVWPSTCVRFSTEEYDHLLNDAKVLGKSIPQLLKSAYFVGAPLIPLMDAADRRATLRALDQIGNNINQIARHLNSGIREGVNKSFVEVCEQLSVIRKYMGGLCGDYKGSF